MPVDLNEDRMISAMRVLEAADRLNAQANRDRQFDLQTEMQFKEYDLNRRRTEVAETQQRNAIDSDLRKTAAAKAIADFSSIYDPTDTDHRSKADWYRNWAIGEGMSAQEINQGLANVDNKTAALDNQLAGLRASSGIQDWETVQTPDGRRKIDIGATISKANYLKQQLDEEAKSWTPRDRQLESLLIQNNARASQEDKNFVPQSHADIRAMVNENRRTLSDYQTVVSQGLWDPPGNFSEKFVLPLNSEQGIVSKSDIGYKPRIYSRENLELDPGYIKARGYAARIASGEEPVFEQEPVYATDEKGNTKYDANRQPIISGYTIKYETVGGGKVAKIARWVDTKRENAVAETDKKIAEAQSAQQQALFDTKYGELSSRAKTAANIQTATGLSINPATREAGQAAIDALFTKPSTVIRQDTKGDGGNAIQGWATSGPAPSPHPTPTPTK